jgi:hypothetical protein
MKTKIFHNELFILSKDVLSIKMLNQEFKLDTIEDIKTVHVPNYSKSIVTFCLFLLLLFIVINYRSTWFGYYLIIISFFLFLGTRINKEFTIVLYVKLFNQKEVKYKIPNKYYLDAIRLSDWFILEYKAISTHL